MQTRTPSFVTDQPFSKGDIAIVIRSTGEMHLITVDDIEKVNDPATLERVTTAMKLYAAANEPGLDDILTQNLHNQLQHGLFDVKTH